MSKETETFDVDPDTEGILSVKQKLQENRCTDTLLYNNLDFCERVFRHNPLIKAMTLQVRGFQKLVRIGKVDSLIYTVLTEGGQTRTDCCVYCGNDIIQDADIKSIHFSVHSCYNHKRSRFTAAKELEVSKHQAIKITCNNFSITYTPKSIPNEIKLIQTKCVFSLEEVMVGGLLEKKCWIEKEKPSWNEVIACFDYLIEKYLTVPEAPESNCRFIVQGNKEIVEIISETPSNQPVNKYAVIWKNSKVSMYPPLG